MGFGDFSTICSKNLLPLCALVGPPSPISGGPTGIQATCYARSIEVANTVIFEAATDFMHILALGMAIIMILHVRSKFTAVGRKEITTFFYIYMLLTLTSLILDSGVSPPGSGSFPFLASIQNGFTSALCTSLLINGFVGFQLYEDGTKQSIWLLRGCSTAMFLVSGAVSILTFKGQAGLGPQNTVGLFVVLYVFNAICLFVYTVMQIILVANTLQDRWPLGHIAFGVFFFVVGQVLLYVFSDSICNGVQHYLDGLFFATICNLLAVMMVYKYWDSITKEDLEFSVGAKQGNWEVKELLPEEDHRATMYQDANSEYANSLYHQIPCRKRKVRCDLGPVDAPHDPPCVRCRRESKECYFSATRRKRKVDGSEDDLGEEEEGHNLQRSKSRSHRRDTSYEELNQPPPHAYQNGSRGSSLSTQPNFPPYRAPQSDPYGPPSQYNQSSPTTPDIPRDQEVTNAAAAALLQSPINTPGDALHLLLRASGESENINNGGLSGTIKPDDSASNQFGDRNRTSRSSQNYVHTRLQNATPGFRIDPAIQGQKGARAGPSQETLMIWARLRFVRAGWFTAREAIAFIDYYYKNLAPLTPIHTPDLSNVAANPSLIGDEPVLTVTLLTIASRYMHVTGPGGHTRSFAIHQRLWQYLQNMLTRMFWGQEQSGGGFCGSGTRRRGARSSDTSRLRTLGTIESLLLLSDFHPRSIHFPPNEDDEDIIAPDIDELRELSTGRDDLVVSGTESTFAGWAEPAVRSDRMSWSLIGFAHALAYELGVFGTYTDGIVTVGGRVKRKGGPLVYHKRADRLERLLYIYMTQACGRFGFPSMYPDDITAVNLASMREGFMSVDSVMLERQSPEDVIQQYWVEIASINKECNDILFPSKEATQRMIQSGEYITRLQVMLPRLRAWQERLERSSVAKYPKVLLSIEAHYFRLYMNGLALQAVIEQWTSKVGSSEPTAPSSPESSVSSSFSTLYGRNEVYIGEVIDASRTVLRHVVNDLLPDDHLKHAPVRAYFRIVSAAMFLLKTFALGAKRGDVDSSLQLLDQTISALRTSVVDDVHLCLRIADLLESLTSRIRQKFIPFVAQETDMPTPSLLKDHSRSSPQTHASPPQAARRATGVRYVRQSQMASGNNQDGLTTNDNSAKMSDNAITVMPPPRGFYNDASYTTPNTEMSLNYNGNNLGGPNTLQVPYGKDPQLYPSTSNIGTAYSANTMWPQSEEDWLTLDLQPLLDNNNNNGNGTGNSNNNVSGNYTTDTDDTWFGNSFGPDAHNNLEVLGKLMDEGWTTNGNSGGGNYAGN